MIFKPEKIVYFYERPWVRIGTSERDGNTFLHAETKTLLTMGNIHEARDAYNAFISKSGKRLYAVIPKGDKKLERFQRLAGLEFLKEIPGYTIWTTK